MIHNRIVGIGWLLIGLFGLLSSLADIGQLRVSIILSQIPICFMSLAVIFVSYGILRCRLWARIACQVVSITSLITSALLFLLFLAVLIATRDEPNSGPSSGTIIWLLFTLPFIVFSLYSLKMSRREKAT
jgi:hypothetical protein